MMPSAVPSQTRNKAPIRKSDRAGRRITTLSFEQIDQSRRGIFTENISAASRLPRPAYVVREDHVIGANMPDTIKLSKDRSKIYVGLSDVSSGHSSYRSHRSLSRDRTSATSTISKASIIDWTENKSEINAHGLSGELASTLPPVARSKTRLEQPPPGLDTAEIFSYRSVVHKKRMDANKSPRPSMSRGSIGPAHLVPGPPHNTPFPAMTRPDEFAATFRKTVTPRKVALENCNVVLLGGSITPLVGGRGMDPRTKSLFFREQSMADQRKGGKKEPHVLQTSTSFLGMPRFDLPMIDLKCVESPIANLGDLEEKGIRLVRLRRMKKKRKKEGAAPNSDRSVPDGEGSPREETAVVAMDTSVTRPDEGTKALDSIRSNDTIPPLASPPEEERAENHQNVNEPNDCQANQEGPESIRRQSSITTPSAGSERRKREVGLNEKEDEKKEEENEIEGDTILTNRETYTTPLLPDINTSKANTPSKSRLNNRDTLDATPMQSSLDATPMQSSRQSGNIRDTIDTVDPQTSVNEALHPATKDDSAGQSMSQFHLRVEKMDSTPTPQTPYPGLPDLDTELDPIDAETSSFREPDVTHHNRFKKRSSSLLTVPDSIRLSEKRPPNQDLEETEWFEGFVTDLDTEVEAIASRSCLDNADQQPDVVDGRRSVTVATQTTPPGDN